jgi:acetylornithine deacetylase/succinyl-diaminopimelate desuccinylase-like protein
VNETGPPLRSQHVLDEVWDRIDADFDDHLESIRAYLRQPSVSATGYGIEDCASLSADLLERAGAAAEIVQTPGHPAVLGRVGGVAGSLLRYGMYDVQPAEEPDWTSPPFAAEISEVPGAGRCVVARGAVNSKGSLASFLLALESLQKVTDPPCEVRFVLDGEEELGSPHLPTIFELHRERLLADAAFDLDLTADLRHLPEVFLGCKGILSYLLTCSGGDWGGPIERAAHSSSGVMVHSPTWSLVRALSVLADSNERPTIPGLLTAVVPPEDEPLVQGLAREFNTDGVREEATARRLKSDDPLEAVRAFLYEAVVNINGIESGHPQGGKTIVPHSARAAIDIRLAYGIDFDEVDKSVRDLIARVAPEVEVEEDERCLPARTSPNSAVARAMIDSHELAGHPATVWPTAPWWAPYYLFERNLGVEFAIGGAGHGCGAHAVDEYASIEGLREHMRQSVAFLFRFGELNDSMDGGADRVA